MKYSLSKKLLRYCLLMTFLPVYSQEVITSVFNANNVVLPSSQYTSGTTYKAQVYVINNGKTYADADYNKILGIPPADAQGHAWYETDYTLTDGDKKWAELRSPFSSDATYKDATSYQWVTSGIEADMYMRRSFTLTKSLDKEVFLACGHDDAPAEWYINGTLVSTATDGWNNDEYVLLTSEQKALIHTDGQENILAVHVHQNWGGAFADCGLYEADMYLEKIYLSSVENSDSWPCLYYQLNSNNDLTPAISAKWYDVTEDESYWQEGVGPFSSDANKFYVTDWNSSIHPLLIRRHFNLTASQLAEIKTGTLSFNISYDENPKVYLNGKSILTRTGYNDNNYYSLTLTSTRKAYLREGDNVIAVSVAQGSGSGHIDFGLSIRVPYTPDTDGIKQPTESTSSVPKGIYTLQGIRVSEDNRALRRGTYIINGKKTIIQ